MRSPLETIEGAFDHAIFTTYSIDLHFFEEWVLPRLRKSGVRNVVVFADHAQLGDALDPRGVRSLGRSYHVVSTRLGPGAFHPKLIYLVGQGIERACISSANLTVAGQMRNLEAAIVLDSSASGHRTGLDDVAEFVRQLSEIAPAPTAEALLAALPPHEERPNSPATLRVVHNLRSRLLDAFPTSGTTTAVVPYANDAGARAVTDRGPLTIVTDGARFAAKESFFTGAWTVLARDFDDRRLHGKTYRRDDDWLLVGSPNLSSQALMSTAANGNTELAVVLTAPEPLLDLPDSQAWTGEPLETAAPRRRTTEMHTDTTAAPTSFNAWEDGDLIRVSGIADSAHLEYWLDEAWLDLGLVAQSAVPRPTDARPYLIRSVGPPVRQAIVHRSSQLWRQRTRARVSSRAADVATALPLDLAGVRILEEVIGDLYALGSLSSARQLELERLRSGSRSHDSSEEGLSTWMPASAGDEPRVPELYRTSWKNTPDALLALIRGALRLDAAGIVNQDELAEEMLDPAHLDDAPPVLPDPSEETVPRVAQSVLARYRSSLVRLLARGVDFIQNTEDPALAEFGFQVILGLHERLDAQRVEVDGKEVALVEREELLRQKLALLVAYLRERNGRDPMCLATARVHLADCLGATDVWEPLEQERLDELAYATAAAIIAADRVVAARAAEQAGVAIDEVTARLRAYADRADWSGFFVFADETLDAAEFDEQPLPCVVGREWFSTLDVSPAWRIAAYGAVVGFATGQRYGIVVFNESTAGHYRAHALLVEPGQHALIEAAHRRSDGRWVVRDYHPVSRDTISWLARIGVEALVERANRSTFVACDQADLPNGISDLVSLANESSRRGS